MALASPTVSIPTYGGRGALPRRTAPLAEVACQAAQQLRSVCHQSIPAWGRRGAETILASFPTCPIPETTRLGRTLTQWRDAFLGHFGNGDANNGGAEAVNGLIELARRVAQGFRDPDNHRLRMLLTGGSLQP